MKKAILIGLLMLMSGCSYLSEKIPKLEDQPITTQNNSILTIEE